MTNILYITDILFFISNYLDDKDAFNLFSTNKYINSLLQKYPQRYIVKRFVNDTDYTIITKNYTIIKYVYNTNRPITNLPPKITHLRLGNRYKLPVRDLPDTITHIICGTNFNCMIENYPSDLKYLYLGWSFNQKLKDLPKELILGGRKI